MHRRPVPTGHGGGVGTRGVSRPWGFQTRVIEPSTVGMSGWMYGMMGFCDRISRESFLFRSVSESGATGKC